MWLLSQVRKTNLRNQTIGQWETKNACDERGTAKEEEVPMESSRFLQRELLCLRSDTANILQYCQNGWCLEPTVDDLRDRNRTAASVRYRLGETQRSI